MKRAHEKNISSKTASISCQDLGSKSSSLRKANSITQSPLAAALGLEVETISRYVRGLRNLSLEQIEAIAKILDVATWKLLVPNNDQKALTRLISADKLTALSSTDLDTLMSLIGVYVSAHALSPRS
ncbi:helix-turn-helix transcriptional regulator [Herbaspirillum sp. DW155]|uniref:helix-turn-helix domain-containing protein n=1 Tax=Herbaspirillum sp. DW155 TaxID=3095609 RepID=UPI0030CF20B5